MGHVIVIGKLTLKKQTKFTQYSECAAWTDYVTCEPQTVDLKRYDDGYWIGGAFDGILTETTFPKGSRNVGTNQKAAVQTQSFGGAGDWLDSDLFSIEITHPDFEINKVSEYSDGRPMLALQRKTAVTT